MKDYYPGRITIKSKVGRAIVRIRDWREGYGYKDSLVQNPVKEASHAAPKVHLQPSL